MWKKLSRLILFGIGVGRHFERSYGSADCGWSGRFDRCTRTTCGRMILWKTDVSTVGNCGF